MYSVYFQQIVDLVRAFTEAPLYSRPEFWSVIVTGIAVIVALVTPWIVNSLNERPRKSRLIFRQSIFTSQDAIKPWDEDTDPDRLLGLGRLIFTNEGRYIAKSVEACIDRIVFEGKERSDFIPMPLVWTHGQLGKSGLHVRDIYPSQTVYLDFFRLYRDSIYVGNQDVQFAVATGAEFENLSGMNIGESLVYIKLYQESGQVNEVCLRCLSETGKVPIVTPQNI